MEQIRQTKQRRSFLEFAKDKNIEYQFKDT